MIRFLLFVVLLLVSLLVEGQVCTTGSSIALSTQTQVNDFGTTYSTCSAVRINGSLTISGSAITDINPLSKIQYVAGGVTIMDLPQLNSLSGLNSLDSIGGNLNVEELPLITDLDGFSSLKKVGTSNNGMGSIGVANCVNLNSLNGLQNISRLFQLSINSNPSLINLSGLDNLEEIEGSFSLDEPAASGNTVGLISFEGLYSLKRIGGGFFVGRLSNVVNFRGLESLEFVGSLQLTGIQSLAFSVTGLDNLTTVGNSIQITQNTGLNSIVLPSLTSVGEFAPSFSLPRFQIQINDGLLSVELPDDLIVVGNLSIDQNPSLTSISGLGNLSLLPDQNNNRNLSISSNNSLTDLSGLKPVMDIGSLFLNFNPLLATCEVPLICDFLSSGGGAIINNNAPGCNSVGEVEAACFFLPVTWQSFTATPLGKGVQLNWSTAYEENNAGYRVEHSHDGIAFNDLSPHLQPRPENADSGRTYEYFHETILGGMHYYRIRQEDLDGAVSYSEVRLVELEIYSRLRIYPTVVVNELTIESSLPKRTIRLLTLTGQELQRRILLAGVHQLDMSDFLRGCTCWKMGPGGCTG